MINIGFKKRYNIVHVTNEIGEYLIGGMGTFIDNHYNNKTDDIGFIHIPLNPNNEEMDIDISKYPGNKDILVMNINESEALAKIDCDIIVLHYWALGTCITEDVLKNHKLVYVVHSVPTIEPFNSNNIKDIQNPFGQYKEIGEIFSYLCNCATQIVCVSNSDKNKLLTIYPNISPDKITVIYNGMNMVTKPMKSISENKNKFGYIGRMDYRKGILETVKAMKNISGELNLACSLDDRHYLQRINDFIDGADMNSKIKWLGFCIGKRKKSFFNYINALIIPSLYEPFGYVVLEAISEGVPIIASKNGGIGEIVLDYKYTFDPLIPGSIEEAINLFLNDDEVTILEEFNRLATRIRMNYTATGMIINYNKLFDKILKGEIY